MAFAARELNLKRGRERLPFFKPLSLVVFVISAFLVGFDRLFWRWTTWAHGTPNLNGTWRGELLSSWKDPQTGHPRPPLALVLVIRQTFTAISVRVFTAESASISVSAGMLVEPDSTKLVNYVFRSEPNLSLQDRSRIHYGGARLEVRGKENELMGSYWTDRETSGEIRVRRLSSSHVLDFETGARLGEPTKEVG